MTSRLVSTELSRREQCCINAVCRVIPRNGSPGTGFVIAHRLIITNNHVLPDEPTCDGSHVEFFYEKGMKKVIVKLDPKSFFATCITPGDVAPPTKKTLDFTIVALEPTDDESLKKVYLTPLSIFKEIATPEPGNEAFIIQHPKEGEDSSKKIPEGQTQVLSVDEVAVSYNTPTKGGSSGGPVLNSARRLYALHRLGRHSHDGTQNNQGVLIRAIVDFLSNNKKDSNGKFYMESLQAWIAEKETPKNRAASAFFLMARRDVEKAREYLKHSKRKFEAFDRLEVIQQFSKAILSCHQAIQIYKRQPSSDPTQQAEAQYILKEIGLLKWQRLQILLDLYLPLCLPNSSDQEDPFLRLLLEDQPLDALDDIIEMQEVALKEAPELKEQPSICFFFAIVYEAIKENSASSSAQWYVRLAQIYLKNKQNIFWIRNCLDRAHRIHSQIILDKEYITMNEGLKAQEKKIGAEYLACLDEIKNLSKRSEAPSCLILHDETEQTKEWIRSNLRYALMRIGARPVDETDDNTANLPQFAFNSTHIQNSNFILQICTPRLRKDAQDHFSQVFFDLSMLMRDHPGFTGEGIFAFLIRGSYAESTPFFFTSGAGNKIDAMTTENYYINSLSVFANIMGIREPSLILQLQDRFKTRKRMIEQSEVLAPSAPVKPIATLPVSLAPSSTVRYAGLPRTLSSAFPREGVNLKDLFEKFNMIILTQPEGVLFKTGKTCLAQNYSTSKGYEYVLWFDARSKESLQKSFEQIREELKPELEAQDLISFLAGKVTWLLIFDGAESEASLQPYLPKDILLSLSECPAGMRRRVLITSRNRSWTCGAVIPVEPFTADECLAYIKNITTKTPDESQYRHIAMQVRGIPRKVSEFAQWVKKRSISFGDIRTPWVSMLHAYSKALEAKSNVPIFNPEFIGRAETLAVIEECFEERRETPVLVSLQGPSGYGKTQIAAHFALVNVEKYAAICWIDCTNADTIASSYQQLAAKFNIPSGSNLQEAVKAFLNTQKSWLIIFDHLSSYDYIPGQLPTSYGHVLITASQPHSDKKCSTFFLEVPLLTLQEGALLVLNAKQDAKQSIEEREALTCVESLKNHPLYLICAIKYLVQTKQNVIQYLKELDSRTRGNSDQIPGVIFEQTWYKLSSEETAFLKFCVGSSLVPLKRALLNKWAQLKGKNEIDVNNWLKSLKKYAILDFDSETVFISPLFSQLIKLSSSDKETITETLQKLKP